mgnify:CR=1 FL=1
MDLDKMDRKEHFRTSTPDAKESSNQDKRIETGYEDNLNLEDEKKELQKDNVEKVDESQVIIENERFDEETINNAGGMNTVKYRTKEVANILGVSEQTIRNNAAFFEPYLNIEKAESGHRRYGRDSIDKLRLIFQLKKDKKSMELDPHDGEEFGYVIQGKVTLVHGEEEYEVKKGETFYLKGNLPHYIVNKHDTLAKVIWVSTPPIF